MWLLILQLWTSYATPTDRQSGVQMYGNWQSCLEDDGTYAERIHHYKAPNGKVLWSLHLGPKDEFALYKGEDSDDLEHDSPFNLLGPAYKIFSMSTRAGGRNWTALISHALKLHINIIPAGGSRDECDSFVVKIERIQ